MGAWLFGTPSDPHVRNTQSLGGSAVPRSPSGCWRPVRVGGRGEAGPAGSWRRRLGHLSNRAKGGWRRDEAGWRIYSWRCGQGPRQQSCDRVPELLPTACSSHREMAGSSVSSKPLYVWDPDPQGSPSGGACMVHPRGITPPKRSKSRPADRALRDIPPAALAGTSRAKGQRGSPSDSAKNDAQKMPPPEARRRWELASQSFEARARRIPYSFGCLCLWFNFCKSA